MRRMLLSLAMLILAQPLRAGVYNLDPPPSVYRSEILEALQPNTKSLEARLADLRGIDERAQEPGSLRAGYRRQTEDLLARQREGILSPIDRINLGACLIRLGRLGQAQAVLEEAERVLPADDPAHFLILLNLARAYQEEPELLPRAVVLQTRALKIWPDLWLGWSSVQLDWYRRVETFNLRLMNLRQAEGRATGGRAVSYSTVDDLFSGVRFVGARGRYEAGGIDFAMRNKLPRDAESIVIQLLLGEPNDNRLLWLYGELLNARGDIENAYQMLDYLVNKRLQSVPELLAHRRVLAAARGEYQQVQAFVQQPADWQQLFWVVAPRGALLSPGLGDAAHETAWIAGLQLATQPVPKQQETPVPTAAPASPLPDWRSMTVSFLTGIVVAMLARYQWQQWRRRTANGPRPSSVGPPSKVEADSR